MRWRWIIGFSIAENNPRLLRRKANLGYIGCFPLPQGSNECLGLRRPSPDVPYTRVTEYKHLTGQTHPKSSITFEFPCAEGDPYYPDYPVPRSENQLLFKRYEALSIAETDVTFVGRLATYR
jgi:hypothetical protein